MNGKGIAGFLDQTVTDEAPSAIRTIYKAAELDIRSPTEPFGSDPFWKRFDDDTD